MAAVTPSSLTRVCALLALSAVVACSGDAMPATRPMTTEPPMAGAQPMQPAPMPEDGGASRAPFCAREGDDVIRDIFCADSPPPITSLADIENLLEFLPVEPGPGRPIRIPNADPALGSVAVLGHSTALPGHLVSSINPRAIVLGERAILAFQRGVQRLEIVVRRRDIDEFVFYLVSFEQACNQKPEGCGPGDLYTPSIEHDWLEVDARDEEDLKNTNFDCRQCHRRARDRSMLLMRELESPWTHFFMSIGFHSPVPGISGSDLLADYLAAKGDERYGSFAIDTISPAGPYNLEGLVPREQPLLFDTSAIQFERHPYRPEGYEVEPQQSPTWERAYEAFKRGEQLALPYVEQRATDPDKLAALTRAYADYREGKLDAAALPDLADVFPDDPRLRARIGLQTEPDATPPEALIQACASCHNDVLDQDLSRARFSVAVARLDRAELDLAIERISLPRDAPGAMPPPEARQLDPGVREPLIEYLRRDPGELDDPILERAAQLGMAGGGLIED